MEDVRLEDVAHHLAYIFRFNGASKVSVAQHAVYVSLLLEGSGFEYEGLHHDDGEAYVGDMIKWFKQHPQMGFFREAEDRAQAACYMRFRVKPGVPLVRGHLMSPEVEVIDRLMLRFEGLQVFGPTVWKRYRDENLPRITYPDLTPEEHLMIGPWDFWSSEVAKERFLRRHDHLVKRGFGR